MLLNVWLFHHTSSDKLRFQVLPLGNRRLSVDTDGTHSSQTFRVQDHPQGQMFDERRIVAVGPTWQTPLMQTGPSRPLLAACLLSPRACLIMIISDYLGIKIFFFLIPPHSKKQVAHIQ